MPRRQGDAHRPGQDRGQSDRDPSSNHESNTVGSVNQTASRERSQRAPVPRAGASPPRLTAAPLRAVLPEVLPALTERPGRADSGAGPVRVRAPSALYCRRPRAPACSVKETAVARGRRVIRPVRRMGPFSAPLRRPAGEVSREMSIRDPGPDRGLFTSSGHWFAAPRPRTADGAPPWTSESEVQLVGEGACCLPR